MRLWKRRVRATVPGVVVSVKVGARTRVAVTSPDGDRYYLMNRATVKIGKKVRKRTKLGYL